MKIETIHKEGEAIQFSGINIKDICEKFNVSYRELNSKTYFKGKKYSDVIIRDERLWTEEELLAGDVVFKDSESNQVEVIPFPEFCLNWRITG